MDDTRGVVFVDRCIARLRALTPGALPIILVLAAITSDALAAQAEDGLYAIAGAGTPVHTLSGKDIHLSVKLTDPISKVIIRSTSNDNQTYYLLVEKQGAFPRDYSEMACCAGGHCVSFNSGSNSGGIFTAGAQITSAAAAQDFAKFFATAVQKRAHPGYALATSFRPAKGDFAHDESLPVTLEIRNVGPAAVTFQVGGKNEGARDNQFGFTAYNGVIAVPDTGEPIDFGGRSFKQTLRPGETFQKDVDLRKWFTFRKPGSYEILGTYELSFLDTDGKDDFVIWQDYAAASFRIIVK